MPFLAFLRANAPFLTAGFLLSFLSTFGQTSFIAIFAGEIRTKFGLSHGDWGTIYAAGTLASAFVMLWAGVLTDRFRVRAIGAVVVIALAVACLAMAANPWVAALPVVIFALRFLGQGMASHISGVAMARWFVASRGRALAIAGLGFAAGEVVLPLSFVALKTVVDWRWLWVTGAAVLCLMLPVLVRLLRLERTPQSMAEESQAHGLGGRMWTRRQALRTPLFWMVCPVILCGPTFGTAFFFQQVHMAEVKGWSHLALVAIFPVYTMATVAAMLGSGWAVDRFGALRLMAFYPLPLCLFFLVMPLVDNLGAAAAVLVLFGMSSGSQATIPVAFWAEAYGTRHLGAVRATSGAVMVVGSAVGPILTGRLIDQGISFPDQMPGIAAWTAGAILLAAIGIARARSAAAAQIDVIRP
ncbi:MAG: MFS transporter [Paracoccaceae bacterium]|nr:MAG: MFS transporter [Paracoccaceae bacterium]